MKQFNDLNLRIKLLLGFVAVFMLLIVLSFFIYAATQEIEKRERLLDHTNQLIRDTDAMLFQLVHIEIAAHGFLLTGKAPFLTSYSDSLQTYTQLQAHLQATITEDATLDHIRQIDHAVQVWRTEVLTPAIALRREVIAGNAQEQDVLRFVHSGADSSLLDAILQKTAEFRQLEEQRSGERSTALQTAIANLRVMLLGGFSTALVIGIICSLVIANDITRRIRMVAHMAVGIAEGRLAETYTLPEGRDEIGRMATSFVHMVDTLRAQVVELERRNVEIDQLDR